MLEYCPDCGLEAPPRYIERHEVFDVLGKDRITVLSRIAVCVGCSTEIESEHDAQTLDDAYRIYRIRHPGSRVGLAGGRAKR